jgi:uncharacterized protein
MGRIAVAGATGLVGSSLCSLLSGNGHEVARLVRRNPSSNQERAWNPGAVPAPGELDGFDAVVNLAGHPISSGLWTTSRRKLIRDSRTLATRHLAVACVEAGVGTLVNASAVGYYGDRGDDALDESSACGRGFLADTCVAWEHALASLRGSGVREVRARFGMILSRRGGALGAMLPAYRLGLGGPLGGGEQWVSWIALHDAVSAIVRCVEDPTISGPVLVVSPQPVRQRDFARTLGAVLGRPAVLPVPSFLVKVLLGDLGRELFLWGQRCRPRALESKGFGWKAPELGSALDSLLRLSGT